MKHRTLFLLLFLLAFLLRAWSSTLINKGDVLAIEEWSRSLYEKGVSGSYFRDGWVYSTPTQPPLMMLLYWFSRYLYEHRYLLSQWHNVFRLPPTFIILWVDKNGPMFSVRLWGILADCLAAILAYLLIKKAIKRKMSAFWAMTFLLFNPLIMFDSSVWGQVDLLSPLLALVSLLSLFYIYKGRLGKLISPILFTCGILIKPTILMLAPFYLFLGLKEFFYSSKKDKNDFSLMVFGFVLSIGLTLLLFLPFWDRSEPFFKYVNSTVTRRIMPSAKGVSKVATSGYTFFTIFYDIDRTLGSQRAGFLTLDQWGDLFFVLINLMAIKLLFVKKKESTFDQMSGLCFIGYLMAEGTFLFKTNMAERYFFPAFLFIYLLYFLAHGVKIKSLIIFQFIIWFVNLTTSFYLNDNIILDNLLRQRNYLGTRILSLFNVLTYMFIVVTYLRIYFSEKLALIKANKR